jgi:hypothetical protein
MLTMISQLFLLTQASSRFGRNTTAVGFMSFRPLEVRRDRLKPILSGQREMESGALARNRVGPNHAPEALNGALASRKPNSASRHIDTM